MENFYYKSQKNNPLHFPMIFSRTKGQECDHPSKVSKMTILTTILLLCVLKDHMLFSHSTYVITDLCPIIQPMPSNFRFLQQGCLSRQNSLFHTTMRNRQSSAGRATLPPSTHGFLLWLQAVLYRSHKLIYVPGGQKGRIEAKLLILFKDTTWKWHPSLPLTSIGQNLIQWLHLPAREAGKCNLQLYNQFTHLKLGNNIER